MSTVRSRLLGALVLAPCLCLGAAPTGTADANADVYGTWRVIRDITPEGAITSKSARQLQAIIGKLAVIGRDRFAFNGSACSHPRYTRHADDTATYFYREYRVDSKDLALGERVTIVDVECGLHTLYPADKSRLIIASDGDFFQAVRVGETITPKPDPAKGARATSKANGDIFGTWTIDGITWEKGRAPSRQQAKLVMGLPVYIDASSFSYNATTCTHPVYTRRKQDKAAYFHGDWRSDAAMLPLPSMLTAIETACGTIYPVGRKRLLIEDKKGLFYSAVPVVDAATR